MSEFAVSAHVTDPEGIAVFPGGESVFLIAAKGIAEFSAAGDFVQVFDYGFLEGTGVEFRLPGGGTFAPSSDPNDARDAMSLYVTCRGVDNGAFPEKYSLDGGLAELRVIREPSLAGALRVPSGFATIQEAVDAAEDGETILIEVGSYQGPVDLGSRKIKLVSEHFLTGDPQAITSTVINGHGADFVIRVGDPDQPADGRCLIHGLTICNGDDGITATDPFDLVHCVVSLTTDGIDYEGGGGTVRNCRFHNNRDDAIDLDGSTTVLIEQCNLSHNRDDGIEIRLHPYEGPDPLKIVVRDNLISNNGEDGIQLIGYDQETAREFRFEGNRIVGNSMAGVGLMSGANTRENYEAAPLPERLIVVHNTFVDNEYHITGGASLLAANNIFANARAVALKGQVADSLIVRNLVHGNHSDATGGTVMRNSIEAPPGFVTGRLTLTEESAAINAGLRQVDWLNDRLVLAPPAEIRATLRRSAPLNAELDPREAGGNSFCIQPVAGRANLAAVRRGRLIPRPGEQNPATIPLPIELR